MKKWDFSKKDQNVLDAYHEEFDAGHYDYVISKYRDPATKYALSVLDEDIISSEMIKLDSFRHLQDLRRQDEDPNFKYTYDLQQARQIVQFASLCPNPDTGKPMPLDIWQLAILCKIVAWRDSANRPRFSDIIVSIARTNGKTYLSSIIIAYFFLLNINNLSNQDLAYIGTTASQTDKGWRYIASTFRQIDALPGFKKLAKQRQIRVVSDKVADKNENRLLKMSQVSGVFDAFHFKVAVVDEAGSDEAGVMHVKDNKSKISTGMTQTAGQIIQISTAYPDSRSYLYEDEKTMRRIMQKDYDRAMDSNLCMVWEQDDIHEAEHPETWAKSNPLLNLNKEKHDTMLSRLVEDMGKAKESGSIKQFENKSLNIWLQAKVNSAFELEDVEAGMLDKAPIDIDGRDVIIGLDLSHKSDDTGIIFNFPYIDTDGQDKHWIYPHSFVPLSHSQGSLQIKMAQDNVNYYQAEKRGYADVAKNRYGLIDQDQIYHYLLDFVHDHNLNVLYFCYDAWEASPLITRLDQETSWNLMPVRQGTLSLSQPTTYTRQMLQKHCLTYPKYDPTLPYALKNAILLEDNHGVKVDKDSATAKIDLVDALVDTMFRAQYYFDGLDPDKKPDKKNPFDHMTTDQQNDYFDDLISLNGLDNVDF